MPPYAQSEAWAIDTWWAKQAALDHGASRCATLTAWPRYILKRLLLMLPTLLGVLLVTFVVTQFVPGGPVEQYLAEAKAGAGGAAEGGRHRATAGHRAWTPSGSSRSRSCTASTSRRIERFWQMLGQFARFDLGHSFFQNKDVWQLVHEKLPVSISLGLWTFFISYLIAVPLGVAKAVRAGTRFDLVTTLLVLVGYAIPGLRAGRGAAGGLRRPVAVVPAARPDFEPTGTN